MLQRIVATTFGRDGQGLARCVSQVFVQNANTMPIHHVIGARNRIGRNRDARSQRL